MIITVGRFGSGFELSVEVQPEYIIDEDGPRLAVPAHIIAELYEEYDRMLAARAANSGPLHEGEQFADALNDWLKDNRNVAPEIEGDGLVHLYDVAQPARAPF